MKMSERCHKVYGEKSHGEFRCSQEAGHRGPHTVKSKKAPGREPESTYARGMPAKPTPDHPEPVGLESPTQQLGKAGQAAAPESGPAPSHRACDLCGHRYHGEGECEHEGCGLPPCACQPYKVRQNYRAPSPEQAWEAWAARNGYYRPRVGDGSSAAHAYRVARDAFLAGLAAQGEANAEELRKRFRDGYTTAHVADKAFYEAVIAKERAERPYTDTDTRTLHVRLTEAQYKAMFSAIAGPHQGLTVSDLAHKFVLDGLAAAALRREKWCGVEYISTLPPLPKPPAAASEGASEERHTEECDEFDRLMEPTPPQAPASEGASGERLLRQAREALLAGTAHAGACPRPAVCKLCKAYIAAIAAIDAALSTPPPAPAPTGEPAPSLKGTIFDQVPIPPEFAVVLRQALDDTIAEAPSAQPAQGPSEADWQRVSRAIHEAHMAAPGTPLLEVAARWHLAEVNKVADVLEYVRGERDQARAELEHVGKQAEAAFQANLEARAELAAERKKREEAERVKFSEYVPGYVHDTAMEKLQAAEAELAAMRLKVARMQPVVLAAIDAHLADDQESIALTEVKLGEVVNKYITECREEPK